VLDVPSGADSAMRERAYPADPAGLGAAAVRSYDGTRVAPAVKHFPGFGRATANTDDAPVTIDATRDELATDLEPFRAAVEAGVPAVMVAHAVYPAYDGAWIASQSRPIVTDLLRGELGFDGVVATDSMEADAVLSRSDVDDAAVYAIYAGCDLLVLTGRGSQLPVYDRLLEEARRSPEFRARLAESAERVRALKGALGLES
jgi:beta-N-acetylhexosaminidase